MSSTISGEAAAAARAREAARAAAERQRQEAADKARRAAAAARLRRASEHVAVHTGNQKPHDPNNIFAARNGIASNFYSNFFRPRPASAPPAAPPTPARKVQAAYNDKGAPEAAKVLREEAEKLDPPAAAKLLTEVKPTVNKIVDDLNHQAREADGPYAYMPGLSSPNLDKTVEFDTAMSDLAAAANHAAKAPNGSQIVSDIARPMAQFIMHNNIGRYDEALGKAIANGGGAELSVEVIRQLHAAGKAQEADDIFEDVEDGVNELKDNVKEKLDDYSKASEEFNWLVTNWGPMMSDEELKKASDAYMEAHPEVKEKSDSLDKLAASTVRTLDTLSTLPNSFQSLGHDDDVQGALGSFLNDKKAEFAITAMPSAVREFESLVARDMRGEPNLLDKFKDPAGLIKNVQDFSKQMAQTLIKASVSSAIEAQRRGDPAEADRIIDNLNKYSKVLGIDEQHAQDLRGVLKQLQTVKSKDDLRALDKKLNDLAGPFSSREPLGRAFRGAAILLSLPSTIDSLKHAGDDPLHLAEALYSAAGLGTDSAELLAGFIRGGTLEEVVGSRAFEFAGNILGGVGVVLDGVHFVDDVTGKDKDFVNAGFDAAAVGGGAAMLFAAGATTFGVGAVVLLGAGVGKYLHGRSQEANKHENGTTEKFLRDGGVSADIAYELRNQDGSGHSPGPAFAALAGHLGVKPQDFLNYLNNLTPDQVHDFVQAAHSVDPDNKGHYQKSADNDPMVANPMLDPIYQNTELWKPRSLDGLVMWMAQNHIPFP